MEKTQRMISIVELKRLLVGISDSSQDIGFRFRMLGEMWHSHFLTVVRITDNNLVLHDETKDQSLIITDLTQIMQFELDSRWHNYVPNFHYDVTLKEVFS